MWSTLYGEKEGEGEEEEGGRGGTIVSRPIARSLYT